MGAGARQSFADAVELSGLCCLFGNNLACFVLYQPAAARPETFMLAEGESKFGITLITVDGEHHRAQIEQCGVKKFLSVRGSGGGIPETSTEAVASVPDGNGFSDADRRMLSNFLASEAAQRIQAGNPVWAGGDKNSNSTAEDSKKNSSTSAPAEAASADDRGWYRESLGIEQDRLTTAEEVLTGRATALPRTPLTPATTPARLVGKETFFSNHIPGYVVPGYTQPLASLP